MKLRLGLLLIVVSALSFAGAAAEAKTRALVVGVSGYPNLAQKLRLTGPKNDSREVANTLARLGVPTADIRVLADGVENLAEGITLEGPGTKAAILGALDELAKTSQPGDLVVFYFSGHGTQQPDLDGDEQSGADEVFLPYDVGKWGADGIENALVDDEFNVRIRAILDKGADFFGIIDACHSATGFRAFPDGESVARQVDPAELGVPAFVAPEAGARALVTETAEARPANRGRAAFFYAAQEIEVALERTPKGGDADEFFGVFTYNLLRRLNETPNLTYRTLHQAVVDDIKRGNLMSSQTPELEGELLDEPVLRLTNAAPRRQWRIFSGKLQAGGLDGIDNGSIIGLYEDAATPDDKPVAHAVVDNAGATKSTVTQIAYPCAKTAADGSCADTLDVDAFKKGRFARVVEPGLDFSITLSEPVRLDPNDGEDYTAAIAALKAAVGSQDLSSRVSLKAAGYDIAVGLVDGKLAFAPGGGMVDRNGPGSSPRLTLPDNPAAAEATVASAVQRIARVLALQRLSGPDAGKSLGFSTRLMVARARPSAVSGDQCSSAPEDYEAAVDAGDDPSFGDCDIVSVAMKNGGRKPIDVTALLIGRDFSITPVWPVEGAANRIHMAETATADILQMEADPATASEERLIFLAVPGVSKSHTVFDNLEAEGLRASLSDEPAEITSVRDLLATGLTEMMRSATTQPARIDEEMSVDIKPFLVGE